MLRTHDEDPGREVWRDGGATERTRRAASDLCDIVRQAERIYAEKYQTRYEAEFPGQFAVVDIVSGRAFVAEFPEDAITLARAAVKDGVLHLIRIGAPSAFELALFAPRNADLAWLL